MPFFHATARPLHKPRLPPPTQPAKSLGVDARFDIIKADTLRQLDRLSRSPALVLWPMDSESHLTPGLLPPLVPLEELTGALFDPIATHPEGVYGTPKPAATVEPDPGDLRPVDIQHIDDDTLGDVYFLTSDWSATPVPHIPPHTASTRTSSTPNTPLGTHATSHYDDVEHALVRNVDAISVRIKCSQLTSRIAKLNKTIKIRTATVSLPPCPSQSPEAVTPAEQVAVTKAGHAGRGQSEAELGPTPGQADMWAEGDQSEPKKPACTLEPPAENAPPTAPAEAQSKAPASTPLTTAPDTPAPAPPAHQPKPHPHAPDTPGVPGILASWDMNQPTERSPSFVPLYDREVDVKALKAPIPA